MSCLLKILIPVIALFLQTASEQPLGSIYQLQNTADPLILYKTLEDEMTTSDDYDLQNDRKDSLEKHKYIHTVNEPFSHIV